MLYINEQGQFAEGKLGKSPKAAAPQVQAELRPESISGYQYTKGTWGMKFSVSGGTLQQCKLTQALLTLPRYNFDVRKGPVKIEWFVGAETNITYNALDRHVEAGNGDRVAFYWEGNDLNEQTVTTYKELLDQAS